MRFPPDYRAALLVDIMTHTHPPHHQELAPRPEDDISRWIDVDSLCPDHDGQPASAEDSHGQYSSVQAPCDPAAGSEQRRGPSSSAKPGVTRERGVRHREDRAPGRVTSKADHAFYTMCFPANPAKPEGDKKRRRDFSHQRRLEVARVRRAGACIRCRIRRVSGEPCAACQKSAGALGPTLCSREKLTKIRFASMDTHYIDVATHLLDQELIAGTTHVGPPRAVTVSLGSLDCPGLEVEVQDFYTRSSAGWLCCWAVVSSVDGCLDLFQEESSHYALTRLPDPETVIQWAEATTVHQDGRLIGLHQAMDSFILRYSKSELDLPMKSLVRKVHRLNCLAKVRLGLVLGLQDDGSPMPPSCAFHTQFCLISKGASQAIERDILGELESVVFGTSGIGPSNHLALWATLWCLMLMYRTLVRSYVAFGKFPCHVPKEYSTFPETKLQMGTNFYHYMVSLYAALFRTTTPLYTDFRLEGNRMLLGNDEHLIRAFTSLRTESFYLQRESTRMDSPEDQLIRSMVLEHEARLRPRIKAAH